MIKQSDKIYWREKLEALIDSPGDASHTLEEIVLGILEDMATVEDLKQ